MDLGVEQFNLKACVSEFQKKIRIRKQIIVLSREVGSGSVEMMLEACMAVCQAFIRSCYKFTDRGYLFIRDTDHRSLISLWYTSSDHYPINQG